MWRLRVAALLSVGLLAIAVLTPPAHAVGGQAGYLQTLYQGAPSSGLTGVAVDSAGNVFFSDDGDNEIKELKAQSQTVTVIAGDGTKGASTPGQAVKSSLDQPAGLAVNRAGDVYFADSGNRQVDEIEPSGGLSIVAGTGTFGTTTPGPATKSDLSDPTGVTVDSAGNVYIADTTEAVVDKVTPDGTLSIVAGIPLSQGYPSTSGGMATSTQIDNPNGVALDSSGNLYISDGAAAMVYKVTPSGTLSIFAGISNGRASGAPTPGPATSTDLHDPLGVTVDQYGNVFIADEFYVEEVTPSGVLSIVAGGGTQAVTTPGPATQADIAYTGGGVATDSAGNLYFTQTVSGADTTGSVDEVFGVASAPATVDPTATNVSCAASNVADGAGTQCTATVTDTASTGYTPPTGTVTFSTSPYLATFSPSATCTLSATDAGTASCTVTFVPDNHENYTLTATYSGDGTHQASTGQSGTLTTFVPPTPPIPVENGGGTTLPGVGYEAAISVPVRPADVASVQVSCTGSVTCNLTLTATVVEKLQGGKLIAITALARPGRKPKKTVLKTVVVGSTKVTIAAGQRRTVTLHLNATGRRLVAKHRLKTKLTISQKGSAKIHTARFTFTAPKPAKQKIK